MHSLLLELFGFWKPFVYVAAFISVVIEGDGPLFAFGFLAHQRSLNLLLLVAALYVGTVIGDMLWYLLGYRGLQNLPRIKRWADRIAEPFDGHLTLRPFRTLFVSKFIYGVHHAFWVRWGILKFPLRGLAVFDLFTSAWWIGIIGGLGYFSRSGLHPLGRYVRYTEMLLLGVVVLFFVAKHFADKLLRKKL